MKSSAGAVASWTSITSTSFGVIPAISNARCAARAVAPPTFPRSSAPETIAEPRTHTGSVVICLAFSSLTRIAAAAPSPMGEHMRRVSGSDTIGEARISSRV